MSKEEYEDDFDIGESVLVDLLISMQREKKNVQRYPENYHKGYLKEVEKEIARLKEMRAEELFEEKGGFGRKKKPVKRVVKRVVKKVAPKKRVAVKARR